MNRATFGDGGAGRRRVAILISGRGSNMMSLVEAARDPAYPAEIAVVISNRPDAAGLAWARAQGIAAHAIDHKAFSSREAFEAVLDRQIAAAGAELIALAGFMRLLTPAFTERWAGRMINIHPSLLPAFKGLDTHARALEAGVCVAGCTVHFVVAEMDGGPIVGQAAVAVLPDDTAETLAARVLAAEHMLYPRALAAVAAGRVEMADGRVIVGDRGHGGLGSEAGPPLIVCSRDWTP